MLPSVLDIKMVNRSYNKMKKIEGKMLIFCSYNFGIMQSEGIPNLPRDVPRDIRRW